MICLDTNVVIYFANGTLSENIIGDEPIAYASVTFIESLGFPDIRSVEELRIKEMLATFTEIPLNDGVIRTAVHLRQEKKMSLGDSIIAATALENNCVLWTANTDDFLHITGLKMLNPLDAGLPNS